MIIVHIEPAREFHFGIGIRIVHRYIRIKGNKTESISCREKTRIVASTCVLQKRGRILFGWTTWDSNSLETITRAFACASRWRRDEATIRNLCGERRTALHPGTETSFWLTIVIPIYGAVIPPGFGPWNIFIRSSPEHRAPTRRQ